jgi:hypothetical protein
MRRQCYLGQYIVKGGMVNEELKMVLEMAYQICKRHEDNWLRYVRKET